MHRWLALCAALALAPAPARATPLACADLCPVQATAFGYVPPALEISSGATVIWTSADLPHPTAEATDQPCFRVEVGPGEDPTPVRFTLGWDDAVYAQLEGTIWATRCSSAVAVGTGAFALPYNCLIHPWMRAALVMTTA